MTSLICLQYKFVILMEAQKKNKYKMVSQNAYKKKIYNSDSLLEIPEYLLKQKIVSIQWIRKNHILIQQLNSAQNNANYQCSPLDVGHEIDVAIQYENMNLDRITISFGTISFSNTDQQTQAKCIFTQPIPAQLQIGSSKIMDSVKALNMIVLLDFINGKLICKKNNIYEFSMDQLMSMKPNRTNYSCSLKVDNGLKLWGKIFGRNTILNEQILDCHQVPMTFLFSNQKVWIQFLLLVNEAKNQPLNTKKNIKASKLLSNISTDYLEKDSKELRLPKISLVSKNGSSVISHRDTVPKPLLKQNSITCLKINNIPRQSLNKSEGDKDISYFGQFQRLIYQDNYLNDLQILDLNKSFQQLQTPQYKQKQKKIMIEIQQRQKAKAQQKLQIEKLQKLIKQLQIQKEKLQLQNMEINKGFNGKQILSNTQKQISKMEELKRKMKCDEVKLKAWICMNKSKQNKDKKLQRIQSNRNSLPISDKFRKSNTIMTSQIQKVAEKARFNRVKRMISELVTPQPTLSANYGAILNLSFQK